jgi:ElaB/YqjD/DUF883 family membrane-anchored ribosome-binding protein
MRARSLKYIPCNLKAFPGKVEEISVDMASLLKNSANVFMAGTLARLVAKDLAAELRHDIERSPYGAAGAATLVGVVTGILLTRRRRRRSGA